MLYKSRLLVAALAAVFALPALAEDAPAASAAEPPYSITANVGFTSDYAFRGISQTFRQPAIQGGVDFAHTSGLFLGTWASNVSGNQYTNASMEWDFYGGYSGKVTDDLGYTVGLISVFYPGGKTSTTAPTRKWDTTEMNVGATWKGLNLKYSVSLTDWYGINATGGGFNPQMWAPGDTTAASGATTSNYATADSKGSGYIELNYSTEVADKLVLSAHVGRQKIKNFDKLSYSDYKIGITKDVGGYVLGAAYTSTNASDNNLYVVAANGDRKNLRGGILALSVTHAF